MNIEDYFDKFYENIKLTSDQREDAKTKYTGVCKKLHDHYYPYTEWDGSTKLLIGSYGKHTNIRPPRDVDVIFILPPEKLQNYRDNISNPQSQLLQDVKNILEEKYTTTEKIRAWGKVVLVEFADGTHNVEVLPGWKKEDGMFLIPNSENGGSWEDWDPKSEIENIQEFDKDNGITKRLIRMAKKWSENCSVNLKAYRIETEILDFFFQKLHEGKSYSIVVRDFFQFFYNAEENSNSRFHLSTAYTRARKACEFEESEELENAVNEWKKIFGNDFPSYKTVNSEDEFEKNLSELVKKYPSSKEEFLSDNNISFSPDLSYKVGLNAKIEQDGFRMHTLKEYLLNGFPLKKYKTLTFSVKHNVPEPFEVKWKVRNFGEEAERVADLRGEISPDLGKQEKIEQTKYRGEHYVECYIIQNNICVAFSRIMVPISSF